MVLFRTILKLGSLDISNKLVVLRSLQCAARQNCFTIQRIWKGYKIVKPTFILLQIMLTLFVFVSIWFCSVTGLSSWSLPATTLAGSTSSTSSTGRSSRPQRSKSGQGNLETGSLLSQRQRCWVPVRHGSKRSGQNRSWWTNSVHAQVKKNSLVTLYQINYVCSDISNVVVHSVHLNCWKYFTYIRGGDFFQVEVSKSKKWSQ